MLICYIKLNAIRNVNGQNVENVGFSNLAKVSSNLILQELLTWTLFSRLQDCYATALFKHV